MLFVSSGVWVVFLRGIGYTYKKYFEVYISLSLIPLDGGPFFVHMVRLCHRDYIFPNSEEEKPTAPDEKHGDNVAGSPLIGGVIGEAGGKLKQYKK